MDAVDWLLDSDPAIRWQVMRDLLDATDDDVAAEHARRWPLENPHPGKLHFATDEGEGKPSRWNTLRAMRVLRSYGETPRPGSG